MHNATETPPDTESTPDHSADQNIPHHESRKYRKRTQAAEQQLADLQRELDEKSNRLTELEQTVTSLERRSRIDEMLLDADAIDLESARLLTEIAVADMEQPDIDAAVSELKRRKPYLFRIAHRNGAAAQSPRFEQQSNADEQAAHAAAEASATGSRHDLLRYLRLRRKKS